MSTSPYLVAAYLGSAALYGGYLAHLLRRRRVLAVAVADREATLAGMVVDREATLAGMVADRGATLAGRDASASAREATLASRGAPDTSPGAR
jgi:hypothetical protein